MKTLEAQLQESGLDVVGRCDRLSDLGAPLLQASAMLRDFTPEEVDVLGAGMLLVRAAPGQPLIREGETGEWMMLLLKGTVDITKRAVARPEAPVDSAVADQGDPDAAAPVEPPEPEISRLSVLRAGAAFGEMSMLDSEPRYASCTAIDEVEAGVLGRHEVAMLIRDHPGVGAKLLVKITQLMAQRLRNTSNQLIKLMQKKA
ncbi:MAG: cyclic nucleotide-binding domain-containing protein [Comamonadaceae bacterium]|nr:MAG: cyclic nucleotide-binding domain-containing protein [Comamonadaceae bacterium]